MLRACGRALFTDINQRVATGVAAFEGSARVPSCTAWTEALEGIAGHGPELFQSWALMKARLSASDLESFNSVCSSSFIFVCCLAEFLGFSKVLGRLERAWERAGSFLGEPYKRGWDTLFSETRALASPSFAFSPFDSFMGDFYFPGPLVNVVVAGSITEMVSSLFRASLGLLNAEVVSVLFFVGFLEIFNDADSYLTVVTREQYGTLKARGLAGIYNDVLEKFVMGSLGLGG